MTWKFKVGLAGTSGVSPVTTVSASAAAVCVSAAPSAFGRYDTRDCHSPSILAPATSGAKRAARRVTYEIRIFSAVPIMGIGAILFCWCDLESSSVIMRNGVIGFIISVLFGSLR